MNDGIGISQAELSRAVALRRKKILALAVLPLTLPETAEVLGVTLGDVGNDRRILKDQKVDVPDVVHPGYGVRLVLFINATQQKLPGLDEVTQGKIAAVLETSLKLKEARTYADGIHFGINVAQNTLVPREFCFTQRIVDAVFGHDSDGTKGFDFDRNFSQWSAMEGNGIETVMNFKDLAFRIVKAFRDSRQTPINGVATVVITGATKAVIENVIATLPLRQREILALRFPEDRDEELTLAEIGEQLGITRQRVEQVLSSVFDRIRKFLLLHHDVSPISTVDVDMIAHRKEFAALKKASAKGR